MDRHPNIIQLLGPPLVVLRSIEASILQNNRILISPDVMYSIRIQPGQMVTLSLSSHTEAPAMQRGTPGKRSSFAPSSLQIELFEKCPPRSQREIWGVGAEKSEDLIGNFCLVCEVWPNGKLQKEEVQISQALLADLQLSSYGQIFYLHPFSKSVTICHKVTLSLLDDDVKEIWGVKEDGLGMEILRKLVLSQLHYRTLLLGNLVHILVLGDVFLFQVRSLETSNKEENFLKIDADFTVLVLDLKQEQENRNYLSIVQKASGENLDGRQKESAQSGALVAAQQGLVARSQLMHRSLYIPDSLSRILHSLVTLPLTEPDTFLKIGLVPPKGVILYGPPGSGKTLLACWAAQKSDSHFFVINGPSLVSEHYGESESALIGVFSAAKALCPSLIFIDEVDAIFQTRTKTSSSQNSVHRMLTTLLTQFDTIETGVVVLAATNQINSLDSALRRPGRFDCEIEVSVPSPETRKKQLEAQLSQIKHELTKEEIYELSLEAHGFLPADISALCQEASMVALRRIINQSTHTNCTVNVDDFAKARNLVRPSGLRELQVEVPSVYWDDVGGLEDIKQQLKESIEWPMRHRDALERMGVEAPKGVLLFGPPGCSKTLLAKAIATESGMNFISLKGSELLSAFVGQSEKAISHLFSRARQMAPCIIFFDEVDGLLGHRDSHHNLNRRVFSQILTELDGVHERGQVIILGATNKPQMLDSALLRPGRFDRLILVPPPDFNSRRAIFEVHLRKLSISEDVNVEILATKSEGFSGADIASVCWEAGIEALEESLKIAKISMLHFSRALEKAVPSLDRDGTSLEFYKSFQRTVIKIP